MTNPVKCYGGPLHGKTILLNGNRFHARMAAMPPMSGTWPPNARINMLEAEGTYTAREYAQQSVWHGQRAIRRMTIAVIDGAELSPRESYELSHAMRELRWEWEKPSILEDFDGWWRWTLYHEHRKFERDARMIDEYGPWFDR